jgi:DNA-binding NarL/FixJ family response regulator
MAADGLTNPQIAQVLFVSTRTVAGHLTHVFRKLGVTARTELDGRMR